MRVAALVPSYPPRSRVGAWVATHAFLAHLATLGHHVDVFVSSTLYRGLESFEGIAISPDDPEVVETAVSLADIVVSHLGDTVVAAALANKWGKSNVRMAHGVVDPVTLVGADLVVFNSHHLAASIDCPSPWIVCHPPVDPTKYATVPGDRVTLVNLSESKGGELFGRLARCAPHRRFLGVTGGYGRQSLGRYPNVEVIDTTANMRDDVYARTRILLMPSEQESWGMAGVEAMASGIPTIAHPTDGLVESLGTAGIFIDRDGGQAWLDEIERLHEPVEWAEASARALARSAELDPQTDLERFVTAIEALHCTGVPV